MGAHWARECCGLIGVLDQPAELFNLFAGGETVVDRGGDRTTCDILVSLSECKVSVGDLA